MFYVYELIDPRDGSVFYVGKGKGQRRFQHERDAVNGVAGAKCDRIRAILASGWRPTAEIVRTFSSEQDAYDVEALLIETHGLDSLTNRVPGGGKPWPKDPVKEARAALLEYGKTIRRVLDCFNAGISVRMDGLDLVPLGRDIALRWRETAGSDYFAKYVGAL